MNKNSIKFDDYVIENLKDDEFAKEYLNASLEVYLEDGDFEDFAKSLERVIKARDSVSKFAKETKLNRSHLYSLFKNEKKPQFETVATILNKLGFKLKIA